MSDKMRQISFGSLMDWVLTEYKSVGSVFGVFKHFKEDGNVNGSYEIFGSRATLPFGPAAGPHTQLAQNLIAGYVAGARFFELKTVQTLDGEDLPVSKPCILAEDEGYNVEWSTELYVPQAMDEYIKGWFAIKLLSREFGLGAEDGFIFNMSVGYDLEGIKSEKINNFIEGLKNAEKTESWKICKDWAAENVSKFKNVDKEFIDSINPKICNSIALSTLHGCPPEEIERIATYLIREKGLHTFIKCNPTLLGYEFARNTLDGLGFDYISFDDHHFKADLQFEDAVPMLGRLQAMAQENGLDFGVKLTNTFPVKITESELPGDEMYMSGRSLFPLSIEVADRLSKAFDGKLQISFSGGVDVRNIKELLDTGIWPITLATTLLKPGGYERLHQIATELSGEASSMRVVRFGGVSVPKLEELTSNASKENKESMYSKGSEAKADRKLKEKAPILDCFIAPCQKGCPFGQDVPAYLRLMDEGKALDALKVITEKNPLPFITGAICSHNCMSKCSRDFYEGSVDIRGVKLDAATKAFARLLDEIQSSDEHICRVAVVGGGPAGLSCAYFLAKSGCDVTIFERENTLGGLAQHVIPEFRIGNDAISNDLALIKAYGVDIELNMEVNSLESLKSQGFEHIVLAVGAEKAIPLGLKKGEEIEAINLLKKLKGTSNVSLGKKVAVVGGGNTAMDTARATLRAAGVESVSLIYRRTKRYMPADYEELQLALEEGVKVYELLSPISHQSGELTCEVMKLGEFEPSGRRKSVPAGQMTTIEADTVVAAIGNNVDISFFEKLGLSVSDKGRAEVNPKTLESSVNNVYVIGDSYRGPATVAEAISDAAVCASAITNISFEKYNDLNINSEKCSGKGKKGIHYHCNSSVSEFERCLECSTVCQLCADVCPNRANVILDVSGKSQIIHVDFMCNECGNCKTFCPYAGAPYLDKFTLFICEEDFNSSENNGVLCADNEISCIRLDGQVTKCPKEGELPAEINELLMALRGKTEIRL